VLGDEDRGDGLLIVSPDESVVQVNLWNGRFFLVRCGPPVGRVVAAPGHAVLAPRPEGEVSRLVRLHLCLRRVAGPAAGRRRLGLLRLVGVVGVIGVTVFCQRRQRASSHGLGLLIVGGRFLVDAVCRRC